MDIRYNWALGTPYTLLGISFFEANEMVVVNEHNMEFLWQPLTLQQKETLPFSHLD
jgi:hypothetical protein